MIKQLKKRVFWSILLSAAAILLAILLVADGVTLYQHAHERKEVLQSAANLFTGDGEGKTNQQDASGAETSNEGGKGTNQGGKHGKGKKKQELIQALAEGELAVLELDVSGQVMAINGVESVPAGIDPVMIRQEGLAGKMFGKAGGWDYYYQSSRTNTPSGGTIVLMDGSSYRNENLLTILLSFAAFLGASGLFALLAWMLSKRIVKPVEENLLAQKRFIADASHELKTPLTVIDANAAVLEKSIGENKWLGYIQEETGRMSQLVKELLQLSRLDEEQKEGKAPEPEDFDLAEAAMEAALPFESLAYEKGLELEMDLPESVSAKGYPQEIHQVIGILLDNAIKHSDAGQKVYLQIGQQTQRHGIREEKQAEIIVTNVGSEIPPEALPHLFDRFYKADPSRTSEEKGNSYGLGLAIAKAIVDKHQGTIRAESKNGQTTLTVSLPI